MQCRLCPHECMISEDKRGRCKVRENRAGELEALTYGRVTSVAMDPIEKKPLYHFFPGSDILSIGSWGCNFSCRFCQNHHISQQEVATEGLTPERAVDLARTRGSIGIAYTYNEPFIMWEYLRDCGRAAHKAGLRNVLVTNGFVNPEPLEEILPLVDAANIDIKAFHDGFYGKLCGGSLEPVLRTVKRACESCHVELTTLIIPEHNDAPKELEKEAVWIAGNCGRQVPVHLSAYSPRYQLGARPTNVNTLQHAREIFMRHLDHVYLGNVMTQDGADTICAGCGRTMIRRSGYRTEVVAMESTGECAGCGAGNNLVMG